MSSEPQELSEPPQTPAETREAQIAQLPYRVEAEGGGCEYCQSGHLWTVVGPDGVALGQSWLDKSDAEDVADHVNMAFEAGESAERQRREQAEHALRRLVEKLDEIFADSGYATVFAIAQLHVGPYRGPQCEIELAAAKELLAARQEGGPR